MVTLDEGGWAAEGVRFRPVPPDLEGWVEQLFTIDFREAGQAEWKVLPDTCGHLLVHLSGGSRRSRAAVVGARTESVVVDVGRRAWTVGARFRPGALAVLVDDDASRLTDGSQAPGAVWGALGDRFEVDVSAAPAPVLAADRVLGLLRSLVAHARPIDWRAAAFAEIVERSGGTTSVARAADRLGIAPRTLRGVAGEALGLPPKRYARVVRLFRALEAAPETSWGRIAARAGFADQAHLVRDCRDLIGETPARFAARGRPSPIRSRHHEHPSRG